jgi:2,3-dihydroxybenzoate decarboxylase
MAKEVAKNPKRFAGFASLSMHDPRQAAEELRRAVKELGLKGAIINDYQSAGEMGDTMLMYDQPQYDPFWAAVQVCVYH